MKIHTTTYHPETNRTVFLPITEDGNWIVGQDQSLLRVLKGLMYEVNVHTKNAIIIDGKVGFDN